MVKRDAAQQMKTDARMVHKLIRKTAREFAGCFYEYAAHDNQFYKHYPNVNRFINREWAKFVKVARETLAKCLTSSNLSESEKTEIYEALLANSELPYSQQETQIVNIPH